MFLIAILILIVTGIFWYHVKYGHRNKLLAAIPAPKRLPLLHNALEFVGKTPRELFVLFEQMNQKFGNVFVATFDPFDDGAIFISDPNIVEVILTSQKHLKKSEDYDMMKGWLGNGLLLSIGQKWRQRRKILTPAFHFQILEKFFDVMNEQSKVLVDKIKTMNDNEFDIHPLLNLFALDVICESAMGCKINAQHENSDYVKAVKELSILLFHRANDPIRRYDFIYQFTEMSRREKELLKIVHGFTEKVIIMRKKNSTPQALSENDVGAKQKLALLDLLLQASINGSPLSDSDIREEVDTFMFGGHDTTTSGTSFILYNLARYPEVQQKVFEEIENCSEELSYQDLNNLHYLELVIKETFRLFPPIPYFGRKLSSEFKASELYTFPKNSNLYVCPYLMGRDEKIFLNPLKFDPLRFETTERINPFDFVPFSAGPRNCIGMKFAMMEMKTVVTKLIRNFKISISKENEQLELFSELVMRSANGVVLKFETR